MGAAFMGCLSCAASRSLFPADCTYPSPHALVFSVSAFGAFLYMICHDAMVFLFGVIEFANGRRGACNFGNRLRHLTPIGSAIETAADAASQRTPFLRVPSRQAVGQKLKLRRWLLRIALRLPAARTRFDGCDAAVG
jgi:hypothetical protein